jgi:hypothetical protein
MTKDFTADPTLGRLADAVLIPPFPDGVAPDWIRNALRDGLAGVTLFGPNVQDRTQLGLLVATLRSAADEPVVAIDEEGGEVNTECGIDRPRCRRRRRADEVRLCRTRC